MPNRRVREILLADAVGATGNGTWQDAADFERFTVSFYGASPVGTLQLMGSCEPSKPADATDGAQIGGDISSYPAAISSAAKWKWIKIKCSAFTSGTLSANLCGDSIRR